MKKFGLDIMTANMREGEAIGRILLPMPTGRQGWHDIMYVDADSISEPEREAARKTGKDTRCPDITTAKLAWDERGSQKKGTSHVRLDVTLPAEQDAWEADVALGMNPEGQPVCRVALPDNGLCEVYCHGKLVTISGEGRESADWNGCQAEFRGRMIRANVSGGVLSIKVTDEHRPSQSKNKKRRRNAPSGKNRQDDARKAPAKAQPDRRRSKKSA